MSALQDRTELDSLPLYLPAQNAVLIGRLTGEESGIEGKAAYYIHWRDGIHIGDYDSESHAFTPEFALEAESRVMSQQVRVLSERDASVELSSIGESLMDAYEYARTGQLPEKQSHVHALLGHGFSRQEIAKILNISPSTVDSQRMSVREKVNAAHAFVELEEEKRHSEGVEVEKGRLRRRNVSTRHTG